MAKLKSKDVYTYFLKRRHMYTSFPQKNPFEGYRFYTCELTWNHWECKKGFHQMTPSAIASQIIPVSTWVPTFLDPAILSLKLQKGVVVRPDSNQYTHKSWEEAPGRSGAKSSE